MSPTAPQCPFCSIGDGTAEADIVFRDSEMVAFLDRRPVFPGHVLVVPVAHVPTLAELPDHLVVPLMRVVRAASRAMETGLAAEGSFVAINNRVSQSVPHLHVHVVPRTKGDGLRGFFWPRVPYDSEAHREHTAEQVRTAIAQALSQGSIT